jgi:hypothetical protein
LQDLEVQQNARGYAAVRERLQGALECFQPAACCTLTAAAAAAGKQQAGRQWQQLGVSGKSMAAGMELCRMSKLLIISGGCDRLCCIVSFAIAAGSELCGTTKLLIVSGEGQAGWAQM